MKNPTNQDLHVMLARIEERQVAVVEKIDDIKATFIIHQEEDKIQFKEINRSVNNLHKYAASVAIVASTIGGSTIWFWNKITGQS